MHVFVTGATGWVGSALVRELLAAGHRVSGLARSGTKAAELAAAGATPVRGTLDDHAVLRDAAAAADAVAHLGFGHDFSRFAESAEQERLAIETLGGALEGSGRLLLVTSGVALLAPGRVAAETDTRPADDPFPRRPEATAGAFAARGVRVSTVRLAPSTHGVGETHGFLPTLIDIARRTGVSAFLGDGANRWPGVHRDDAARLYRLVLEHGAPEPAYHAVAEEGVPFRDLAAAIGRRLGLPVEARPPEHFGWLAAFAGVDMPASSARTRAALGWEPTGPGLLADIGNPEYCAA